MMTPSWSRSLGEVLDRQTVSVELTSKKGTKYSTDVLKSYDVIAIGSPTAKKDINGKITGYDYEVYDQVKDLGGFKVNATNLLDVMGMKRVRFENVRGGALNGRTSGWFKADRVVFLK